MEQQKNKQIIKQKKKIKGQSLLEDKNKEIKDLIKIITTRNEEDSSKAIKKLVKINKEGFEDQIIKEAKKLLRKRNWEIRVRAIELLGKLKNKNKEITDILVNSLSDEEYLVLRKAQKALMEQGDLGYILAASFDKREFEEFGGNYKRAVKIAKSLEGEEREELINYLLSKNFIDSEYKYSIISDEKTENRYTKAQVIDFIGDTELKNKRIINTLLKNLKDKREEIREASARALAKIEKNNKEELNKKIKNLLKSEKWEAKQATILLLGDLKFKDNKTIDLLIKFFNDREEIRIAAFKSLMKQGTIGYIFAASFDKKRFEKFGGDYEKAVEMAKSLKGKERKNLINYLGDKFTYFQSYENKKSITEFIEKTELKDEKITNILIKTLGDKDWEVKNNSINLLIKIAKEDKKEKEIVQKAINFLRNEKEIDKQGAIWLFGRLKLQHKEIIDVLFENIKDGEIRDQVLETLSELSLNNPILKQKVENWKLFMKGLEECDSSKVRVIKELL